MQEKKDKFVGKKFNQSLRFLWLTRIRMRICLASVKEPAEGS